MATIARNPRIQGQRRRFRRGGRVTEETAGDDATGGSEGEAAISSITAGTTSPLSIGRTLDFNFGPDGQVPPALLDIRPQTLGQYRKSFPTGQAIGLKIIAVNGQNQAQRFTRGEMDQRCIGEVHGTVGVLLHQGL
jgi:hypothetical protein